MSIVLKIVLAIVIIYAICCICHGLMFSNLTEYLAITEGKSKYEKLPFSTFIILTLTWPMYYKFIGERIKKLKSEEER